MNELNDKIDKELAEQFAKDFGISYDKISIKEKTGWVSYKTDTGGSGGWTEGTPATTIKLWIIKKHYALITEQVRLGRIDELAHVYGPDGEDYMWTDIDEDNVNLKILDRLRQLKSTTKEDKSMSDWKDDTNWFRNDKGELWCATCDTEVFGGICDCMPDDWQPPTTSTTLLEGGETYEH